MTVREIPATKRCRRCNREQPAAQFSPFVKNKDGLFSYCKGCEKERRAAAYPLRSEAVKAKKREADRQDYERHHAERREKQVWVRLKLRYGLTREQYEQMLEDQGHACAICATPTPGGRGNRFHVDHDHETGEVRGLLCWPCNTKLAVLENRDFYEKACIYLGWRA